MLILDKPDYFHLLEFPVMQSCVRVPHNSRAQSVCDHHGARLTIIDYFAGLNIPWDPPFLVGYFTCGNRNVVTKYRVRGDGNEIHYTTQNQRGLTTRPRT
jgi:hypothetical protein